MGLGKVAISAKMARFGAGVDGPITGGLICREAYKRQFTVCYLKFFIFLFAFFLKLIAIFVKLLNQNRNLKSKHANHQSNVIPFPSILVNFLDSVVLPYF